MLSGEGNENSQNKSVGLISRKKQQQQQLCKGMLCTATTWNSVRNFPVTRFKEEMLYVFLFFFFFSLPLIFNLVAASSAKISHFSTPL